jgi:hypothetical protein
MLAVRFYVDPLCPWCYMTSRWIRRVAELGAATIEWGLFSLEIANSETGAEGIDLEKARGIPALRTALIVRDEAGNEAMGRFYSAAASRTHDGCERLADPATLRGALVYCALDPSWYDRAVGDPETWSRLRVEHDELVAATDAFGVPVLRLPSGRAIFGPVVSQLPTDDDALELFRSVTWLTDYENFAELKRQQRLPVDVERARRHAAQQAQQQQQ